VKLPREASVPRTPVPQRGGSGRAAPPHTKPPAANPGRPARPPAPCAQAKPRPPEPPHAGLSGVHTPRRSRSGRAPTVGKEEPLGLAWAHARAGAELRCAALRSPSLLPWSGPAATVANPPGPPRPRHHPGGQSRRQRRRIGCGASFLAGPVNSSWGDSGPLADTFQPPSH
jgi:hypothetical protein